MRDTIRCCISCILPCGALDVIRIVHANGRVEEISRAIRAEEVMQAYPKHVLRRPPPSCHHDDALPAAAAPPRPGILPPNAELQRGKIYFLMPVSSASPEKATRRRRKKRDAEGCGGGGGCTTDRTRLLVSDDQYLSEILSEKASTTTARERRRGRVGVWRPHLESISEASNDLSS